MSRPISDQPDKNRVGEKHGNWILLKLLTPIRRINAQNKHLVRWFYECKCECGSVRRVAWTDIKAKKSTKCADCNVKKALLNSQLGVRNFGKNNPNYKGTKNIRSVLFSRAKLGARKRHLIFDISIEDMQNQWDKQKGLCFYTGIALSMESQKDNGIKGFISTMASLDRIDSSKGYTIDNIVWASKTVNRVKMELSHETFVKMCEMVYKFSNTKQK